MQRLADVEEEEHDPIAFLEALKLDLGQDEVYVFTPKGRVIALIEGATPIDFAYAVHTEVGHHCVGAKVNGRLVPLDTVLRSADVVEIVTSKNESAGPSSDWLSIAQSSRAKSKIRQWFQRERRDDAIEGGREELTKALRREGLPIATSLSSSALDAVITSTEPRGPRRALHVDRLGPDLRAGGRPASRSRTARRWRRRADAHDGHAAAAHQSHDASRRGRLRRGPRRRHDPPGALLLAGARRQHHGFHHPGSRRLGAPRRLLERGRPGPTPRRADHRRRVGRLGQRSVPRGARDHGLRPLAAPARRLEGRGRVPPQHHLEFDVDVGLAHRAHGLRRGARRPDAPRSLLAALKGVDGVFDAFRQLPGQNKNS